MSRLFDLKSTFFERGLRILDHIDDRVHEILAYRKNEDRDVHVHVEAESMGKNVFSGLLVSRVPDGFFLLFFTGSRPMSTVTCEQFAVITRERGLHAYPALHYFPVRVRYIRAHLQ